MPYWLLKCMKEKAILVCELCCCTALMASLPGGHMYARSCTTRKQVQQSHVALVRVWCTWTVCNHALLFEFSRRGPPANPARMPLPRLAHARAARSRCSSRPLNMHQRSAQLVLPQAPAFNQNYDARNAHQNISESVCNDNLMVSCNPASPWPHPHDLQLKRQLC